jgi:threonine/homoserine efflux transporter RhtA
MELEIIWSTITLIGIVLSINYRASFKQTVGPMIIGFTGALWIAYIFG